MEKIFQSERGYCRARGKGSGSDVGYVNFHYNISIVEDLWEVNMKKLLACLFIISFSLSQISQFNSVSANRPQANIDNER